MQVTLPQVPVLPNTMSAQDTVAKALPQIQAQASAPLTQRAIDPSGKSERGNQTRSNRDRAKGGGDKPTSDGRGSTVNIRV